MQLELKFRVSDNTISYYRLFTYVHSTYYYYNINILYIS